MQWGTGGRLTNGPRMNRRDKKEKEKKRVERGASYRCSLVLVPGFAEGARDKRSPPLSEGAGDTGRVERTQENPGFSHSSEG